MLWSRTLLARNVSRLAENWMERHAGPEFPFYIFFSITRGNITSDAKINVPKWLILRQDNSLRQRWPRLSLPWRRPVHMDRLFTTGRPFDHVPQDGEVVQSAICETSKRVTLCNFRQATNQKWHSLPLHRARVGDLQAALQRTTNYGSHYGLRGTCDYRFISEFNST